MDITVYTTKAIVDLEGGSVTLTVVDPSDLIGQLSDREIKELLEAITANDNFHLITNYVNEVQEEDGE